jgi:hypothetical protein
MHQQRSTLMPKGSLFKSGKQNPAPKTRAPTKKKASQKKNNTRKRQVSDGSEDKGSELSSSNHQPDHKCLKHVEEISDEEPDECMEEVNDDRAGNE